MLLNGGPIAYYSGRQSTVALGGNNCACQAGGED